MKTFCEFFAGVGLVREGLQNFGWQCTWANDISKDKEDIYKKNYGADHFWCGDVWQALEKDSSLPKDAFLYTASFPCTDLSVAGNREGLAGSESGALMALFEILESKAHQNLLPKIVLLENVNGFLTSHDGDDVKETVRLFSDLGYYVDIVQLDAIKFTPQSRPRVFCIAIHSSLAYKLDIFKIKPKDSVLSEWWIHFQKEPSIRSAKLKKIIQTSEELNWGLFDVAAPTQGDTRLADIIESNIPDDSKVWWNQERQDHLFSQMSDNHKAILEDMVAKSQLTYGTVYRRMRKGKPMAELRTDGFAGCLRTPKGGSSKQIVVEAGCGSWRVRLLTPREYARLQGVRDSFILPKNDNKGYFAMGDAVCVPVIEFLAQNILNPIYNAQLELIENAA
ncbi:DNA cytosine methyltransferase [Vibrio parahaemolyticus]|uniref:DNA cytosine methyltransferase n=1 Tax=Vibrio parahaemolyticus TaxID=670 RepID=UPI003B66F5FA